MQITVFVGEFQHRINAKNQVAIPARFRVVVPEDERKKGFYLVRSSPDCLYLYTHSEVVERVRQASALMTPARRRQITRRIAPVEMDGQGRILIPAEFKKAAGIRKDVVFIGNVNRVELWAPERLRRLDREGEAGDEPQVQEAMYDIFER